MKLYIAIFMTLVAFHELQAPFWDSFFKPDSGSPKLSKSSSQENVTPQQEEYRSPHAQESLPHESREENALDKSRSSINFNGSMNERGEKAELSLQQRVDQNKTIGQKLSVLQKLEKNLAETWDSLSLEQKQANLKVIQGIHHEILNVVHEEFETMLHKAQQAGDDEVVIHINRQLNGVYNHYRAVFSKIADNLRKKCNTPAQNIITFEDRTDFTLILNFVDFSTFDFHKNESLEQQARQLAKKQYMTLTKHIRQGAGSLDDFYTQLQNLMREYYLS